MFYSETLLSKTGPLARVWLASNLDRKLSKQNVLASKLEDNVNDIIGEGEAPMALRLSSQLLLGVCKIYSRKTIYLMDDCSEALFKIKMAFRPGNVDLPSNQSHKANPNALLLPDTITELDLFAPLPDPDDFLAGNTSLALGQDPTLLDSSMSSQMLSESQTPMKRQDKTQFRLDEDDLGLDLGLEDDANMRSPRTSEDRTIEMGRRATSVRFDFPSLLDDDLGLELDFDDTTMGPDTTQQNLPLDPRIDNDIDMSGAHNDVAEANAAALARADAAKRRLQRDSESPLSSLRSSVERGIEHSFQSDAVTMQIDEEEDPTVVQAAQRIKRRKVMPMDNQTELSNPQMKQLQSDRSTITKAPTYLPHDPLLLQLMEMQRNGTFVSNLLGDGYLQGWAPELRGILSLEIIRKAGDKKRKRDSGIADVDDEEGEAVDDSRQPTPRLRIPQGDLAEAGAGNDFGRFTETPAPFSTPAPVSHSLNPTDDGENNTFDVTEAPLLHPSQSGPVAVGTKKMVHLLREHFAPSHPSTSRDAPSPSQRTQTVATFTDFCPEETTSRVVATKMFFELLVLGTKDAIKVEQDSGSRKKNQGFGVGAEVRLRGKRGLWGDWAEMSGGAGEALTQGEEIPEQQQQQQRQHNQQQQEQHQHQHLQHQHQQILVEANA